MPSTCPSRDALVIGAVVATLLAAASLAALVWSPPAAVAACGGARNGAGPTAAVTPEARAEAKKLYSSRCAVCHGKGGRGDGPGASNLNPKPPNFCNREWQKSITDEKIARAIVFGGAAVGLTSQMAPNPDLEDQPAVVAAFVEHIRKLGK